MQYEKMQQEIKKRVSPEVYEVYKYFADKAPIGGDGVTLITIRQIMKVFGYSEKDACEIIYEIVYHGLVQKILKIEPMVSDVFFTVQVIPTKSDAEKIMENLVNMASEKDDNTEDEKVEPYAYFDTKSIIIAMGGTVGLLAFLESILSGKINAVKCGNMFKIKIREEK